MSEAAAETVNESGRGQLRGCGRAEDRAWQGPTQAAAHTLPLPPSAARGGGCILCVFSRVAPSTGSTIPKGPWPALRGTRGHRVPRSGGKARRGVAYHGVGRGGQRGSVQGATCLQGMNPQTGVQLGSAWKHPGLLSCTSHHVHLSGTDEDAASWRPGSSASPPRPAQCWLETPRPCVRAQDEHRAEAPVDRPPLGS